MVVEVVVLVHPVKLVDKVVLVELEVDSQMELVELLIQ
jgi:hypothetical protein